MLLMSIQKENVIPFIMSPKDEIVPLEAEFQVSPINGTFYDKKEIHKYKCSCGNKGCLEEYVSVRGIKRTAKKLGINKDILEIQKMAKSGNKKARKVYKITGKYLGMGLSNIVKILDPDLILIGGGVSNSGNFLLKPAIKEMKKRTFFKTCPVKIVKLKDNAGAIGAACLFLSI